MYIKEPSIMLLFYHLLQSLADCNGERELYKIIEDLESEERVDVSLVVSAITQALWSPALEVVAAGAGRRLQRVLRGVAAARAVFVRAAAARPGPGRRLLLLESARALPAALRAAPPPLQHGTHLVLVVLRGAAPALGDVLRAGAANYTTVLRRVNASHLILHRNYYCGGRWSYDTTPLTAATVARRAPLHARLAGARRCPVRVGVDLFPAAMLASRPYFRLEVAESSIVLGKLFDNYTFVDLSEAPGVRDSTLSGIDMLLEHRLDVFVGALRAAPAGAASGAPRLHVYLQAVVARRPALSFSAVYFADARAVWGFALVALGALLLQWAPRRARGCAALPALCGDMVAVLLGVPASAPRPPLPFAAWLWFSQLVRNAGLVYLMSGAIKVEAAQLGDYGAFCRGARTVFVAPGYGKYLTEGLNFTECVVPPAAMTEAADPLVALDAARGGPAVAVLFKMDYINKLAKFTAAGRRPFHVMPESLQTIQVTRYTHSEDPLMQGFLAQHDRLFEAGVGSKVKADVARRLRDAGGGAPPPPARTLTFARLLQFYIYYAAGVLATATMLLLEVAVFAWSRRSVQ